MQATALSGKRRYELVNVVPETYVKGTYKQYYASKIGTDMNGGLFSRLSHNLSDTKRRFNTRGEVWLSQGQILC